MDVLPAGVGTAALDHQHVLLAGLHQGFMLRGRGGARRHSGDHDPFGSGLDELFDHEPVDASVAVDDVYPRKIARAAHVEFGIGGVPTDRLAIESNVADRVCWPRLP